MEFFIFGLYALFGIITLVIVINLVIKRIQTKGKEDFEHRDN